jgi:hypothetical protein
LPPPRIVISRQQRLVGDAKPFQFAAEVQLQGGMDGAAEDQTVGDEIGRRLLDVQERLCGVGRYVAFGDALRQTSIRGAAERHITMVHRDCRNAMRLAFVLHGLCERMSFTSQVANAFLGRRFGEP